MAHGSKHSGHGGHGSHAPTGAVSPDQHDAPDAWHTHTTSEPLPQHAHAENIDTRTVAIFGIGGFLLIVGAVLATVVYFNWYKNQLITQRVEFNDPGLAPATGTRPEGLQDDALARRAKILEQQVTPNYAVTKPDTGAVRIPLPMAMKKIEERYGKR